MEYVPTAEANSTCARVRFQRRFVRLLGVSNDNFGPLIAYLVPGAIVLLGGSQFSSMLRAWFASTPTDAPTIGGFLYLTVASLGVGMTVSAVRWATVDQFHARTGLRIPRRDFSKLGRNVDAFSLLIRIHYEHYQFYGLWRSPHKAYYANLSIIRTYAEEMNTPLRGKRNWMNLALGPSP